MAKEEIADNDGQVAFTFTSDEVVALFSKLFYTNDTVTWEANRWLGHHVAKCPLDCWIYQEIIHETKPDLIIETGTAWGGSTLFLASICDMVNNGRVISIDIVDEKGLDSKWGTDGAKLPVHPRIAYLVGSSVSDEIQQKVKQNIWPDEKVMVILDSDHEVEHVLKELEIYSELVTVGNYLIVEDTNLYMADLNIFPKAAVERFLASDDRYRADPHRERFLLTFNPGGYLVRVQ